MVICTLGDLLLDVVVKLARPLAEGDDTGAETRAGGGGQAANVAAWAAALGAHARFIGKRGADAAGDVAEADLLRRAVDVWTVRVLGPVAGLEALGGLVAPVDRVLDGITRRIRHRIEEPLEDDPVAAQRRLQPVALRRPLG